MLIGNLTRDPEIRYTPKGSAVADIGLAVNRRYRVEDDLREEVTYVDVTFWGRQAETIGQYMKKGRPIFIEGRLQLDSWEDKNTGQKRSRLRVIGENFQFLGGRDGDGSGFSGGGGGGQPQASSSGSPEGGEPPASTNGGGTSLPPVSDEDDDIPF